MRQWDEMSNDCDINIESKYETWLCPKVKQICRGFLCGTIFWISKPQDGAKTSASILIQQKQIHLLIKEFNDAYEASLDKGGFFSHFQSG